MKIRLLLMLAMAAGCELTLAGSCTSTIPPSIKSWAADLPARADGQYATLDDLVKKQLVMKDALLACKIDLAESRSEMDSAACKCAESASDSWTDDCRPWLGEHTPAAPSPPPSPPPSEAPQGAPTNAGAP